MTVWLEDAFFCFRDTGLPARGQDCLDQGVDYVPWRGQGHAGFHSNWSLHVWLPLAWLLGCSAKGPGLNPRYPQPTIILLLNISIFYSLFTTPAQWPTGKNQQASISSAKSTSWRWWVSFCRRGWQGARGNRGHMGSRAPGTERRGWRWCSPCSSGSHLGSPATLP